MQNKKKTILIYGVVFVVLLISLFTVTQTLKRGMEPAFKYSDVVELFEDDKISDFDLDLGNGELTAILRNNVEFPGAQKTVDGKMAFTYKVPVAVSYTHLDVYKRQSMINVVGKAMELGYLKVPDGLFIDIDAINRYPADKIVLITTGSQGEPLSALSRMASSDHRKVSVTPNDFIIISATPIPGNEKHVTRVVNDLLKLGAEVIYEKMYEVHVSGHACQDELKLILSLTKPKFFIPVHGEYKHLVAHAHLAQSVRCV